MRRREFLVATAVAACTPPKAPPPPPAAKIEDVLGRALDAAKRAGATYADARVVRRRDQNVATREEHVVDMRDDESYGIGVRVLLVVSTDTGATQSWGFAAVATVDEASASRAAQRAVAVARANVGPRKRPIILAPVARYRDRWATPVAIDPFAITIAEKAELLREIWSEARAVNGAKYMDAHTRVIGEDKTFASTEGSLIEQRIVRVEAHYVVTAIDEAHNDSSTRASELAPMQAGWEHVANGSLKQDARKIAEDAVEKMRAPSVVAG
ncbi:MAG TPA: DNA gyrase modulator, partial [Polyangiaceae bacterium]